MPVKRQRACLSWNTLWHQYKIDLKTNFFSSLLHVVVILKFIFNICKLLYLPISHYRQHFYFVAYWTYQTGHCRFNELCSSSWIVQKQKEKVKTKTKTKRISNKVSRLVALVTLYYILHNFYLKYKSRRYPVLIILILINTV